MKVSLTPEGLAATKQLVREEIRTNVTLCFSPAQCILAARAGATCVSPFFGRLDDVASDGMGLLSEICDIFRVQGYATKVLAASLRSPQHVVQAALAGADVEAPAEPAEPASEAKPAPLRPEEGRRSS